MEIIDKVETCYRTSFEYIEMKIDKYKCKQTNKQQQRCIEHYAI